MTVGGSGKTSVTALIASRLLSYGKNAAVVARGYRRVNKDEIVISSKSDVAWEDCGDEPLVLTRSVPGLRVYVNSDKSSAAVKAANDGHNPIIIDDGFQHRKLKRDIDIVCLDGRNPFGNGMMLPSGRLREPKSALRRADIIIIIDSPDSINNVRDMLPSDKPVFTATKKVAGIKSSNGETVEIGGSKCLAFCGLGNPDSFKRSLGQAGYQSVDFIQFRDHHHYKPDDVRAITDRFERSGADFIVTTLKDLVKLEKIWNYSYPLYYLDIEIKLEDEDEFFGLIGV